MKKLIVLLVAVGFAAPAAAQHRQGLSAGEHGRLLSNIGCIDCLRGEWDSVLTLATFRPGATVASLRDLLLNGMDTARVDAYATFLGRLYDRGGPRPTSRDSFVAQGRRNYDGVYRERAAWALGIIRTPAADSVLREALLSPLDPRVRRTVEYILQYHPSP
jgi:hypothetical protein